MDLPTQLKTHKTTSKAIRMILLQLKLVLQASHDHQESLTGSIALRQTCTYSFTLLPGRVVVQLQQALHCERLTPECVVRALCTSLGGAMLPSVVSNPLSTQVGWLVVTTTVPSPLCCQRPPGPGWTYCWQPPWPSPVTTCLLLLLHVLPLCQSLHCHNHSHTSHLFFLMQQRDIL